MIDMKDCPPEVLWLKKNRRFLSLRQIAADIGIPHKTLVNYCNETHSLNESWWKPVTKWVRSMTVSLIVSKHIEFEKKKKIFDGPKLSRITYDEPGQFPSAALSKTDRLRRFKATKK